MRSRSIRRCCALESDIASVACDATRLTEATGWRPRHDIDDMLQALLDDARAAEAQAERPS